MKKYNIIDIDIKLIKNKPFILQSDTIFGFSCSWDDKKSLQEICKIKNRDKNKKFIILISSIEEVIIYFDLNQHQITTLNSFWPGPYSFLLKKWNGDIDCVRVPDNRILQNFLRRTGPLVSTSCNLSGEEPINNINELMKNFEESIDFLIYNEIGFVFNNPSTILELKEDGTTKQIR
ncbi:hypothetical protein ASO20_01385 [Mycoplasma sp. (ex Biomphalaria glabrata)]|uniref:L-threonylcarbamoyladenylate synthase n=1 Tax=Mycoplasma sp. (ex Biomphalaria glabrata) TaxID=1749074 RepID=UPI00073A7389|nr:L-threonylcarbamoyladenylate synthase [Mycoplasma sp. (ex Biomphalaria glabrata)]ALV23304.1 hypothetical protein ASO20_01385 [Mycoplasma sp. (ex Biomphalaria glabrata)]